MDNEMRNQINALADDILMLYKISTPIQNIDTVVQMLGGELQEDFQLGDFSDGQIHRETEDFEFSIRVPCNQTTSRKNFTVAHELGHLFLHMGYLIDSKLWRDTKDVVFYRGGDSELEMQANEFAAAFLMPRKIYKEILDIYSEGGYVLIAKVADYFNVSIDAATYRGRWLGYLKW